MLAGFYAKPLSLASHICGYKDVGVINSHLCEKTHAAEFENHTGRLSTSISFCFIQSSVGVL